MQVHSVKAYKKEHEILTLSQTNIGSLKLKEFADNNSRFDENVEMFSKGLELYHFRESEIAHNKQFLLFI